MESVFNSQTQSGILWDPSRFSTPATTPQAFYPLPLTLRAQHLTSPRVLVHCPSCHTNRPVPLMPYGPSVGTWSPVLRRQRQFFPEPEFYMEEMREEFNFPLADDYYGYQPEEFEFPEFFELKPYFDLEGFQIKAEFQDDFENPEKTKKKRKRRGKGRGRGGKNQRSGSGIKLEDDNHCALCKSNREMEEVYMGHVLKDAEGKVSCPILRAVVCIICGATGDDAHTLKYCPQRKEEDLGPTPRSNDQVPYRKVRNAVGRFVSLKF